MERQALHGHEANTFFLHEPGLVSTFDFDYDKIIDFETKACAARSLFCLCLPPGWIACLCGAPCFLKKNVEWATRAKHVALTVDGIRYVSDRRKTLWGCSCTDKGRESKTVPYDKITDCDVQEPAGKACCCFVDNVLATVNVDTASSGSAEHPHELKLVGLTDPLRFKQSVWAMKRGEAVPGLGIPGRQMQPAPSSGGGGVALGPPAQQEMQMQLQTKLLTEIRDELKELNASLNLKQAPAA